VPDLELHLLLTAFPDSRLARSAIQEVFLKICTDPAVITYRQDILDDLWRNPDFTAQMEDLFRGLNGLEIVSVSSTRRRFPLEDVT
jgi:hypothetical protein